MEKDTIIYHVQGWKGSCGGERCNYSGDIFPIMETPTPGFWFNVKQAFKGGQRWPVVPDVLEQVEGFLKSVGLIVFSDHHVIAAARYHEDDGCHICITRTSLSNIWPTLPNLIIQQPHRHWCPHFITGIYTDNLPLKHWIHFRRSSRWPPTSNILVQRK